MNLPYATLKDSFCEKAGTGKFIFHNKWFTTETIDVPSYTRILDTRDNKAYCKPMLTEGNRTFPAPYFLSEGAQYTFSQMQTAFKHQTYMLANTVEGKYLIVLEKKIQGTFPLMSAAYKAFAADCFAKASRPVQEEDRHVHWVWFRKPNYRLTEEIVVRSSSWIELNPGYTFHLWSSLANQEECAEFLENVPTSLRDYFLKHVQVHYVEEFYNLVLTWFKTHMPEQIPLLDKIWESVERQDIIMKTDYTRNILLAEKGGIYTDFNDLLCLAPVESLLEAHAGQYVGVTDNASDSNASNYFMYAAKGNEQWLDIVKRCTQTMPVVYEFIHNEELLRATRTFLRGEQIGKHTDNDFLRVACFALELTLPEPAKSMFRETLRKKKQRQSSGMNELLVVIQLHSALVKNHIDTETFAQNWRFARTDVYLSKIMHNTNLPIFCRMQSIPIYLVPFGYMQRYHCLLSYFGHIGDASSYGNAAHTSNSIVELFQ